MKFDSKEQKALLIQVVNAAQITTSVAEIEKTAKVMADLRHAVEMGEVEENK